MTGGEGVELDDVDRRIIAELQTDGRTPYFLGEENGGAVAAPGVVPAPAPRPAAARARAAPPAPTTLAPVVVTGTP